MQFGNGIDIIEIQRIKTAIDNNQGFLSKVYTKEEIAYIGNLKSRYEKAAGIFCAKEAVSKALGTGIRFKLQDIAVTHDSLGKPFVVLNGRAKEIFDEAGYTSISISVSHCKLYAVASAIALKA